MKKRLLTLAAAGLVAMMTMSAYVYAATPQEVIGKAQGSYTAGTNSVYGSKLNQDQLNAVANVASDFATNYVNSSMDNDAKIRAGYNYIKNNVAYIDWRESTYANTAYGALVEKKAACSGMTRAFVALMDAVDVKAYWIHGSSNDHQWNMVEFNDGFYFIDIDANIASGGEFIYKAATHPYAYDTAAYPAIGSHSGANTSGSQSSVTEGWKQDGAGWWYQNADGSYPANAWKQVNGRWYYFEANGYMAANKWINGTYYVGSDGAMLTNTTTPDGYQVGADGAWIQTQLSGKTERASIATNAAMMFNSDDLPSYQRENRYGIECIVMDQNASTFSFPSNYNNLDPNGHEVWIYGAVVNNGIPTIIGEPIRYSFEYDKKYSLDFIGTNRGATSLAEYCNSNNIIIDINIVDMHVNAVDNPTGHNAIEFSCVYANSNSIQK